jgi:hypothetical protein
LAAHRRSRTREPIAAARAGLLLDASQKHGTYDSAQRSPAEKAIVRHPTREARLVATEENTAMNIHLSVGPLVSLIAGILILVVPRLLNYIVAVYLIIIGVIGLIGNPNF